MYCESCGKVTEGGRCAACGRRPRLSLTVYSVVVGWLSILGLFLSQSSTYPAFQNMMGHYGVMPPEPAQWLRIVAVPFSWPWFAIGTAVVLLAVAWRLRRTSADKWTAAISFLLFLLLFLANAVDAMMGWSFTGPHR